MSHEKCKSISRPFQTEDGKWTATIFSACNNIVPLEWRKVNYIPQESKEKLIAVILRDLINGNVHMEGKSALQTFIDEIQADIVKSPSWDRINHYHAHREKAWEIASRNGYWHGQNIKEKMDAKRERICAKCDAKMEEAEFALALEYLKWKPCKDRFFIDIDGCRIAKWMLWENTGRAKWWYAPFGSDGKEFSIVEKIKIERRLEGTGRKVNAIDARRYKTQGRIKAA